MSPVPARPPGARPPLATQVGPIAVLVAAAALRFAGLGSRPVWTDEGSTWTAASMPLGELLHRCVTRDASPPLYYLVTSWLLAIRDNEAFLRLFPAVASLVLVWLTYRLARLGLSRGYATLAMLFAALSPFQVQYAQEARTYVPVAMFMVAAMYVYGRLQQSPGPQRWLPLVLLTSAGLWTQTIAALGAAAQGAVAVLTPTGRRRFWPWAGSLAVAGLLYVPWVIFSRAMAEHLGQSHWYIPPASGHGVFNVVRSALITPFPLVNAPRGSDVPGLGAYMPDLLAQVLVALPWVIVLALAVPVAFARSARGFVARLAWIAWVVPVVLVAIVSIKQSLLLPRYFVFLGPFVMILYAVGLEAVRPVAARLALVAWMLAITLLGLFRYQHDFAKEPWRQVTAHIRAEAAPGRTAVLVPFDADPLAYYLRHDGTGIRAIEVHHADQPFSATFTPKQLDEVEAETRVQSQPYDEVWVIIRSAWSPERRALADRTLEVAADGRARVEDSTWTSYNAPLHVTRFLRADSAAARPPAGPPAVDGAPSR